LPHATNDVFKSERLRRIEHDEAYGESENSRERMPQRLAGHNDCRHARHEQSEQRAIEQRIVIGHDEAPAAVQRVQIALHSNSQ
jgi:hypothetical protein